MNEIIDFGLFQFTPLREGRRMSSSRSLYWTIISIHAPARGATVYSALLPKKHIFQFTPLREGRRGAAGGSGRSTISIHAPARGATLPRGFSVLDLEISIHAPARGATAVKGRRRAARPISIHAPARGATHLIAPPSSRVPISIHAPARGATSAFTCLSMDSEFQFTPLREGRQLQSGYPVLRDPDFNSRPCERGD